MNLKQKIESSDQFCVELEYDKTFFITAKFDREQLERIVTAYLLACKIQSKPLIVQNSRMSHSTNDYMKFEGGTYIEEEDKSRIEILPWFGEMSKQKKNKTKVKECEVIAKKAERLVQRLLPKILNPILSLIIPAASKYAQKKYSEAVRELVQGITSEIYSLFFVYKNALTIPVNKEPWTEEAKESEAIPTGTLNVGGDDGVGGTFAFAYNYLPALAVIATNITLPMNHFLWQEERQLEEQNRSEEDRKIIMKNLRQCHQEMVEVYVEKAHKHFLEKLEIKLRSAIAEHIDESMIASRLELDGQYFGKDIQIALQPNKKRKIKRLIKFRENEIKRRIGAPGAGGSEANYDLTELPNHYQKLRSTWQAAMKDAKKDQKHPIYKTSWRERLSAYQFPDDLIEWLNLDPEEREKNLASHPFAGYLNSRRVDSKRSDNQLYELSTSRDIALEHAARLCDAAPYYYSFTYLKDLIPSRKRTSSKVKK